MAREYKDSGIEWIGLIPKEWNVTRLKYQVECLDSKRIPMEASQRKKGVYPYWGAGSIMDYVDNYIFDGEMVLLGEDGAPFFDRKRNVAFYVNEKVWINNHIHVLKPLEGVNARFLTYYLNIVEYKNYINGSILNKLTQSNMNEIGCLIISCNEQQKITDYLDKVCGEADEMIALQEKMIEELKAYKQSVITEAVTKGLNPDVPMKDSGIDWIGEVPEHWNLEPLKYCFGRRSEKNNPIKTKERLSLSIDKGVTLYAEKTTNLDRFKDDFTQYQLAYPNDIVLNCMNMIVGAVGLSHYLGCVSPVYYVIYPINSKVDALYYSYLLNIPTIRGVYFSLGKGIYAIERGEGRVNTCRLKVSYNDFGRLEIPIPPINEQKEITAFIQGKNTEIDSLIALKQQKIEELKEYKKSVIYEYVTGKKEVI